MSFLDSAYFIPTLIFVAIFTCYMAVDALFFRKEQIEQLERKTLDNPDYETYPDQAGDDEGLISMDRNPTGMAVTLAGLMRSLGINVDEDIIQVRKETSRGGMNGVNTPYYVLFMRKIGGYIVAFLGGLMLLSAQSGLDYVTPVILIVLGLFGTNLLVKNSGLKREKVLLRSFPDTLDLIVVCVESGLALDAALARVCRELGKAHPEITKELNQTRIELALLNDRSQALMNLAERTNLVAFRSLVAALIQTEKFGTSLTDTLRVLSEDYRQTRLMLAEEKAARLPVMMTIPLICFLLPALFLIILGPPFITVAQNGGIFGSSTPAAQ